MYSFQAVMMAIYWTMFAFASAFAVLERERKNLSASVLALAGFCVFVIVVVGTRRGIGADWSTYEDIFRMVSLADFATALNRSDPGYMLVNWIAFHAGLDIWAVNLVCAAALCWGLYEFCFKRPYPMLCAAIAVPYLLIVVGMGYSRQAAAIGLFMVALTRIEQGSMAKYFFWVLVAAAFHKSAIIVAPIGVLAISRNKWLTISAALAIIPLGYFAFLADHIDRLTYIYIDREYESGGALVRLMLGAVAAGAFLLLVRDRISIEASRRLWTTMAAVSIGLLIVSPLSPSSTILDRVALFLIPLQMITFSLVPSTLNPARLRPLVVVFILAVYAVMLFVWMGGRHAQLAWLPYQTYLF